MFCVNYIADEAYLVDHSQPFMWCHFTPSSVRIRNTFLSKTSVVIWLIKIIKTRLNGLSSFVSWPLGMEKNRANLRDHEKLSGN